MESVPSAGQAATGVRPPLLRLPEQTGQRAAAKTKRNKTGFWSHRALGVSD